jgi:pyruvate formate lyase activating enzyme
LETDKALIFDIKKFAIYDGPGIRTTIFFKGCPLGCLWCHNPESKAIKLQLFYDEKKCINCNSCYSICPVHKINKSINDRFNSKTSCLDGCYKCFEACPSNAISRIGKYYNTAELIEIIQRDTEFYLTSKGGITLSGGEPLLQIEFVKAFLKQVKKLGINVIVETCGFAKWQNFIAIKDLVDVFYYDLKFASEKLHKEFTGFSNKLILNNLIELSKNGSPIVIRIPLAPGITDTTENLKAIISFIIDKGLEKHKIELLPYNELASVKYNKKGINCNDIPTYFNKNLKIQTTKLLLDQKKLFTDKNLKVRILSVD